MPVSASAFRFVLFALMAANATTFGLSGCQPDAAEDPRAPFTGTDAAPAGGGTHGDGGGAGTIAAGGNANPGGNGGGGQVVPANACRFTFVYRHDARSGAAPAQVRVAGGFEPTPWAGEIVLADADGDGFYTADVDLVPGRYEYKFILRPADGGADQWVLDADNPSRADDGRGNTNSILDHACPFLPDCVADTDCAARAPGKVCRYYACLDASTACTCDPGFHCNEAGGCVPDPQCDDTRPCAAPLVCKAGVCGPECTVDADCGGDRVCADFACVTPECTVDADCADPLHQVCAERKCGDNPCELHLFTYDPGAEMLDSVHVAGDFNAWAPTVAGGGWAMTWDAGRHVWWTKNTVANGPHQYKFVLTAGGAAPRWVEDPTNPEHVDDHNGGFNSVLTQDCQGAGPGACGDLAAYDWRDAVLYFILVDRFFDSDGRAQPVNGATDGDAANGPSGQYEGGDLAGVTAKLPYLQDLGVTAVWLSAPYENRNTAGAAIDPGSDPNQYSAYHGYWPSPANVDYSDPDHPMPEPAVESRIGTAADLHTLVDTAHTDNMKILFDYVMNHVDSESGLARAHDDWIARDNGRMRLCGPENLWDDPVWSTLCAFTDYLVKFDFRKPEVRTWSVSDAVYWAKAFGIDGYRLDAIKHQPLEWLLDLRTRLNAQIQDPAGGRFYLVGETFSYDDQNLLKRYVNPATMLDGQFDFPFKARLCEAAFTPGGRFDTFSGWMAGNDSFYGPGSIMTNWIGNHDIPRAIHFASREIGDCREGSHVGNTWTGNFHQPADAAPYERLGVAFTVMFTNPGIPLIYYGDEIGLAGGGDPDNRRMMNWNDAQLSAPQRALRARVSALGHIRAENRVLSRGHRIPLSADQDTWVYRMTGCGHESPDVTVALNRGDSPRTVQIPAAAAGYTDLLHPEAPAVAGGQVEIPARGALLLRSN